MQQTELASHQFGSVAGDYLTSAVHAQGADLIELSRRFQARPCASVLDLGCGAGHVSYAVAPHVGAVHAYDPSAAMLQVVAGAARERALDNIHVHAGAAERLPFEDACFDAVVSRLSAHHWRDVAAALREMRRVIKPQGWVVLIDSAGAVDPLCDSHLQTIELLRDPSHVRNYSAGEWQTLLAAAAFEVEDIATWRLPIDFSTWIARMRTAGERQAAIRHVWHQAPDEVREYYRVQPDCSFELEVVQLTARCAINPPAGG